MPTVSKRVGKVDTEVLLLNVVRNPIESGPTNPIQIRVGATSETATIEIEDDGCGIPSGRRQAVFDPFFTTRLNQGGTGLGLSIADGIVADHKGTIE